MTDREYPESPGECAGCGEGFEHDAAIASVDFGFNCHGDLMMQSSAENGLYHHDCLRRELRVPHVPGTIESVWGDYDEFRRNGPEYVHWLLEQQVAEAREAESVDQRRKELADIAIVAIRELMETSVLGPVEERVVHRLHEHDMKGQESIIEDYVGRFHAEPETDEPE